MGRLRGSALMAVGTLLIAVSLIFPYPFARLVEGATSDTSPPKILYYEPRGRGRIAPTMIEVGEYWHLDTNERNVDAWIVLYEVYENEPAARIDMEYSRMLRPHVYRFRGKYTRRVADGPYRVVFHVRDEAGNETIKEGAYFQTAYPGKRKSRGRKENQGQPEEKPPFRRNRSSGWG